jgi:hypothetical protein
MFMNTTLLKEFTLNGATQKTTFLETLQVKPGVECDVYTFINDKTKDLGIIRVEPGYKTPLQKVLSGEKTIEGYISGKGKLVIIQADGKTKIYVADDDKNMYPVVTVKIGELMQWQANDDSELQVYEICYPPYVDGRYENIKK